MTQRIGRWRVGRKLGRTLYLQAGDAPDCGDTGQGDTFLGIMDSPELAALVCLCVNTMGDLNEDLLRKVAPHQRSVEPDDTGRSVMPVDRDDGADAVPEDDRAVPPVPPDADLPVVERDPLGDDTDTRDT